MDQSARLLVEAAPVSFFVTLTLLLLGSNSLRVPDRKIIPFGTSAGYTRANWLSFRFFYSSLWHSYNFKSVLPSPYSKPPPALLPDLRSV